MIPLIDDQDKREIVERVARKSVPTWMHRDPDEMERQEYHVGRILDAANHFEQAERLEKTEAALSRVAKDNIVWRDFDTGARPCRGCQRKINIASAVLRGGGERE